MSNTVSSKTSKSATAKCMQAINKYREVEDKIKELEDQIAVRRSTLEAIEHEAEQRYSAAVKEAKGDV